MGGIGGAGGTSGTQGTGSEAGTGTGAGAGAGMGMGDMNALLGNMGGLDGMMGMMRSPMMQQTMDMLASNPELFRSLMQVCSLIPLLPPSTIAWSNNNEHLLI